MFYRKYFSGTIASATVMRSMIVAGTTTSANRYANQTDVLNTAIVETLVGAGCAASYDSTRGILSLNGFEVSIQYVGATQVSVFSGNATAIIAGTSGAQYQPFNGTAYQFYVTVKGDEFGCIDIFWGTNSAPAGTTTGIRVANGYNKYYNQAVKFISLPGTSSNTMYVRAMNGELYRGFAYNLAFSFASALANNAELSQSGGIVPLIPSYTTDGFILLLNCYVRPYDLSAGNFYNIAGLIYYVVNNVFMVRCDE